MKKIRIIIAVLFMGIAVGSYANAGCVYVDERLMMDIFCAEYDGHNYSFRMDYYPNPHDPGGIYWKMDVSTFTEIENSSNDYESEPNDSMEKANSIGIGYANRVTNATIATNDDADWYSFTAIAGRTYVIQTYDILANTSNEATGLWLYDSEGNQLANDEYGGNGSNDANASITYKFLKSDVYYILVKDRKYRDWTGTYSLRILPKHTEPGASWNTDNEPNDKLALANYIGAGLEYAQTHQLASNTGYVSKDTDRDWYHFDAEAGNTYVIETYDILANTSNEATGLWIYDSDGNQLAEDEYGQNGSNDANASITYTFLRSDTYYVMVKNRTYRDWTGTYSLRILPKHNEQGAGWYADNEPNDKLALANHIGIGLGQAQTHEITSNASYTSHGTDTDCYYFNAGAGRTYVMETFNVQKISDRATGLWLYDANGNELAEDEYGRNGTNDANASITHTFISAGTYYIVVKTTPYRNWTGAYSIRVCDSAGCH